MSTHAADIAGRFKGTLVETLGIRFTEGTAANAKGEVFFNDIPNSKTYKIDLDGKVSLFVADSKRANGQAFGPDGRLYAVTGTQQVVTAAQTGGTPAATPAPGTPARTPDFGQGHSSVAGPRGLDAGREIARQRFAKQKGEPKRVQPSRARKPD